jgi:N6-L-threonylcarbamoyladenine synthase
MCLHTIYHCRNLDGQIKISCKETGINQIAIGGGVSANSGIRKTIKDAEQYGWKTYVPKFEYTTDNNVIGIVGYQKFLSQQFETAAVVSKARIKF